MKHFKWFLFVLITFPVFAIENIDVFTSAQFTINPKPIRLGVGFGVGMIIVPYRITNWLAPSLSLNAKINHVEEWHFFVTNDFVTNDDVIPNGSIYIGDVIHIIPFLPEIVEFIPAIGIKSERAFNTSSNYLYYLSFSSACRILLNIEKHKCSFTPYLIFDRAEPFRKHNSQSSTYENGAHAFEVGVCVGIIIDKLTEKQ
jgi:hypothetical protein